MLASLEKFHNRTIKDPIRRQRQHELLIALIHQQDDLELMDAEAPSFDSKGLNQNCDPALWLDRNRRVLAKYQALVTSSITLDALLDSEGGQSD